ncbi:MAG: signal peptide peptidase SppA [Anaerolineae bacterium]|nr:signal peptide peptidase SppA [Anaerolineae bacterium]
MKSKSSAWVILAVCMVAVMACGGVALLGLVGGALGLWAGGPQRANAVAVIEIKGAIVYGSAPSAFADGGVLYSEDMIDQIEQAGADPSIGALVLDINSPGGSVVASADIYRALKASSKPIVASLGEIAASGGYYIACASQYSFARPATITGSIGVISRFTNIEELASTLGIEEQAIKTGPFKDQGSLFRPLSPEEIALWQTMLEESYDAFVRVVAEGRGMEERQVRRLADGRVLSGRQAISAGLVDAEGNLEDAIQAAAQMAGIEGEPRIVRYERSVSYLSLLGQLARRQVPSAELALLEEIMGTPDAPSLQYLYTGRR